MNVDNTLRCSFSFLQPLKRLSVESPQMISFLKACEAFEDLFPFKKTNIDVVFELIKQIKQDFIPAKVWSVRFKAWGDDWNDIKSENSKICKLLSLPEL